MRLLKHRDEMARSAKEIEISVNEIGSFLGQFGVAGLDEFFFFPFGVFYKSAKGQWVSGSCRDGRKQAGRKIREASCLRRFRQPYRSIV